MIEKSYEQTLAYMICHIPIDWFVQNVFVFIYIGIYTYKRLYEHLFNQSFLVPCLCCLLSRSSVLNSFSFSEDLAHKDLFCDVLFLLFIEALCDLLELKSISKILQKNC